LDGGGNSRGLFRAMNLVAARRQVPAGPQGSGSWRNSWMQGFDSAARYGRMRNPLSLFSARRFHHGGRPRERARYRIVRPACGDAHLPESRCYEAPDGRLVFDINDFSKGPFLAMGMRFKRHGGKHRPGRISQRCPKPLHPAIAPPIRSLAAQPVLVYARAPDSSRE